MTTRFTDDHEWINIEDHEAATVGITLHAQDALGDTEGDSGTDTDGASLLLRDGVEMLDV